MNIEHYVFEFSFDFGKLTITVIDKNYDEALKRAREILGKSWQNVLLNLKKITPYVEKGEE